MYPAFPFRKGSLAKLLFAVKQTKGLYYKTITLRICNLCEIDKYHSKLVSSSLDKTLAWTTNTLAYYGVRTLRIC
jgi:hypothetical protein